MYKVYIDPTSRILYSSYYILGLHEIFNKKNVSFSSNYFTTLNRTIEDFSFEHYFAFVLINPKNEITRYVIDFCDPADINNNAYDWCDYYAKININYNLTDNSHRKKLVSIPPGFGIKVWGLPETIYHCVFNLIKLKFKPLVPFKKYLNDYYTQLKRLKLEEYTTNKNAVSTSEKEPYVFMIATLWNENEGMTGTNLQRKKFIELCKEENCNFEGGFYISNENRANSDYKKFSFSRRYSINDYLKKTKLSKFVFNTPAVHNCHGWKLGEYLAMGKAIISTPLSNELPVNLVHAKDIHIVTTDIKLKLAIKLLKTNHEYRLSLESKSKEYYLEHSSPVSVIKRIVSRI